MVIKPMRTGKIIPPNLAPVLAIWAAVGLYFLLTISIREPSPFIKTIFKLMICAPGLVGAFLLCRGSSGLPAGFQRVQWQMLGTGLGLWVAADYYRLFFIQSGQFHPLVAAWVNWGNIAGFLLIAGGWLLSQSLFRQRIIRLKMILDLTISCGAMTLLGWLIFVFPASETGLYTSASARLQLTYPVLDIALIALLLNVFLLISSRPLKRVIFWNMLGMAGLLVSDLTPAALSLSQPFFPGTGMDGGLILGYSAILTSAYFVKRNPARLVENTTSDFGLTPGRRIQGILPVAMMLVLVVELVIVWQNSLQFPQAAIGITAMLWLLLIARQGVAAGEFELRQYAILFQNTAEPSFITDKKLNFILVNPAMVQICGVQSEADLIGRSVRSIFGDETIPNSIDADWTAEVRLNISSSIYLPVELSLNRITYDSRRTRRIAGTAHDLTPQKEQQAALMMANQRLSELQSALEKMNEGLEYRVLEKTESLQTAYLQLEEQHNRLQTLDQLKSDFVSMVSHELRAPLTNISGGIELLLSARDPLNDRTKGSLILVQTEIQRLTRFVETILDLSALEAERLPLFPEPVSMSVMISATLQQFADRPGAVRLHFQPDENMPPVMADPRGLSSVIFHLIDNAMKYASKGEILVTSAVFGDNIQVSIRDHGPGIPEGVQSFIFEKFFRVDPADSQMIYGHGLGLYMANRMLEAMGGSITVQNCDDEGAEFTFQLPIVKE